MSGWAHGPLVGFDLETTGRDPHYARLVTAAVITITPVPGARPEVETLTWLADPGVPIPVGASDVHGITTEHAREHGRPPAAVIDDVASTIASAFLGHVPVVGHNLVYDLTVMDRECRRHDLPTISQRGRMGPVLDTMVMDKQVSWRRGLRTLTATSGHYDVDLTEAHEANADAMAALRIAWRISQRHPVIGHTDPDLLYQQQVGWRAAQCASLQTYLRSEKDPEAVVDGTWPIHPLPEGWDPAAHPETDPTPETETKEPTP